MSGSLNKIQILGFVGADPEIRSTQSGMRIANLRVATDEKWKDRDGQPQSRTTWHSVVVMADGLVGIIEQYVKKGTRLYAEGSIQNRSWTDKDGKERYSTEIVINKFRGEIMLLDGAPNRQEGAAPQPAVQPRTTAAGPRYPTERQPLREELSDDIPFLTIANLDGLLGKPAVL